MRFKARLVTGAALVSFGTACTAILGIESGIPDDAGTAAPDASAGSDVTATDTGADTAVAVDSSSADASLGEGGPAPDADLPDVISAGDTQTGDAMPFDACTAPTVDQVSGIFVSKGGTDGATCGFSTEAPCLTLGAAIDRATTTPGRTHIFVSAGEYDEVVALAPGLTIEGGWTVTGGTWTSACGGDLAGIVTVVNPLSNGAAVILKADARRVSEQYVSATENAYTLQEAYSSGDVSAVYRAPDEKWSVTAYMKNVSNYIAKTGNFGGYATVSAPRTSGVILNYSY